MKIWLPYTHAPTGSTTFVKALGRWLESRGHEAVVQSFPHAFQFAPWLLKGVAPPDGTEAIIYNSWNAPAFQRDGVRTICVEHLFVLDPAIRPYKSAPQAIFHDLFVCNFVAHGYARADRVVTVSDYTARAVRAEFPRSNPVAIPNGIDVERFSPVAAPPAEGPFRLFFAGTPSIRKGIDLLAPIMRDLGESFELRMTASESDCPDLAGLANVTFLGRLQQDDMIREYATCHALLAPTRLEGLPLSVLEAMACGAPVIASDISSLPEAVDDGVTGLLCPVDEPQGFIDGARTLAADPARREAMARAARTRATGRFSIDRMGEAYLTLLTP